MRKAAADLLYTIETQVDMLDRTSLAGRTFNILMECYESLVDLEMELGE